MPRLAAHERRERRGIILEFWTPPPPPLSPFLWRFGGNASPTHPPGHSDTAAAVPSMPNQRPTQRCVHVERVHPDDKLSTKTRNLSPNRRTTLYLYVCVFACMPLRVYSFFLPFRPFYASMAAAPPLVFLLLTLPLPLPLPPKKWRHLAPMLMKLILSVQSSA